MQKQTIAVFGPHPFHRGSQVVRTPFLCSLWHSWQLVEETPGNVWHEIVRTEACAKCGKKRLVHVSQWDQMSGI